MRKNRAEREFDCIAFKRQAQKKVFGETKNLTLRDQVAYFRKRANSGPLGKWWKRLPGASPSQRRKTG